MHDSAANLCPVGYTCRIVDNSGNYITTTDPVTNVKTYYGIDIKPHHISKYSCQPGYTCDGKVATACAKGKYQPYWGMGNPATDCIDVPKGYYTSTVASPSYIKNSCARGHYCPAGSDSVSKTACAIKTFRYTKNAASADDCGACPSGYFCPMGTADPFICPNGYFCPKDTEIPFVCPQGTFGPGEGIALVTDCAPCYGGRFCSQYGIIKPEGLCD